MPQKKSLWRKSNERTTENYRRKWDSFGGINTGKNIPDHIRNFRNATLNVQRLIH
jgi:hypothetical protein